MPTGQITSRSLFSIRPPRQNFEHALAVGEPVLVRLHAALGGQVVSGQAERVGDQDVVVVRGVVEAPIAGQSSAPRSGGGRGCRAPPCSCAGAARSRRNACTTPAARRRFAGDAVGVEGAGQQVLVVVEEAAIVERRRPLREAGAFQHQRIVMLGPVAGPDVERVDAQPLGKRVRRERRAARVGADQPHVAAVGRRCGSSPTALASRAAFMAAGIVPLPRVTRRMLGRSHRRTSTMAGLWPLIFSMSPARNSAAWCTAAVLVVGNHDFRGTVRRRESDITLGRRSGLNPRSAKRSCPGGSLGKGARGQQKAREKTNSIGSHDLSSNLERITDCYFTAGARLGATRWKSA